MANETSENGFRQASDTRSNAPYFKDQNVSMEYTFGIAPGVSNETLVSITPVDGTDSLFPVLNSQIFNFWLSDSPTGYSLSSITPSGAISATAGQIIHSLPNVLMMQKRLTTTSVDPVVVPGFTFSPGQSGTLKVYATGGDNNLNNIGGEITAAGYRASAGNVTVLGQQPHIFPGISGADFSVVADVASQSLAVEVVGIATTFIWSITFMLQKHIIPSANLEIQPNSLGVATLAITDVSKTPYYLCAQNNFTGQVFVSRQLTTADYGV